MKPKDRIALALSLALLLAALPLVAGGDEESGAAGTAAATAAAESTAVAGTPFVDHIWASPAAYEKATGNTIAAFHESPLLAARVAQGELPPVEERLPESPQVIRPIEAIGRYGGTFNGAAGAPWGGEHLESAGQGLLIWPPDSSVLYPNVIKGFEVAGDARSVTFYLREGMKWSDGDSFDADDFEFWYRDILQNEQLTPNIRARWKPGGELMGMHKIDQYTVQLSFAAPFHTLLEAWASGRLWAASHALKKWHIEHNSEAEALAKEDGYDSWWQAFQFRAAGYLSVLDAPQLNPWVLKELRVGSLLMERNPYYFKVDTAGNQLPYIDASLTLHFENPGEIVPAKGMSGELDFQVYNTKLSDLPVYRRNEPSGGYKAILYARKDQSSALSFALNYTHKDPVLREIFNDIRFRQALSLAIDRDDIANTVFLGATTPFTAPVSETWPGFEEWMKTYYGEYDVARANSLLDEMGLAWDDNQEWRLRPDGKVLHINGEYATEWLGYTEDLMDLVKSYWQQIGVRMEPKFVPEGLLGQRYMANDQDIGIWNTDGGTVFHARSAYPMRLLPPWHWMADCCAMSSVPWRRWLDTNGEAGEEPPETIKRMWALSQEWMQEPTGSERFHELIGELIRINVENLYLFGTVSSPPLVVLISDRMGNVQRDNAYVNYRMLYPYLPEQWYITE